MIFIDSFDKLFDLFGCCNKLLKAVNCNLKLAQEKKQTRIIHD